MLVKSTKGRTPASSDHPSRPTFDNVQDTFKNLIEEASIMMDHRSAKQQALKRDGYCAITGRCDAISFDNEVPAAVELVAQGLTGAPAVTQAAHIFPPSTNQDMEMIEGGWRKLDYVASVWDVMERFGQTDVF